MSHQYPTGIVMPMKRRIELLGWANESEEAVTPSEEKNAEDTEETAEAEAAEEKAE